MRFSRWELWPAWGAGLVFAASAAAVVATLVARVPLLPMHELRDYHLLSAFRHYHFFDLKVYRRAAAVVNSGRPLYATRLDRGLGFTYPPIAALMFVSLRWSSLHRDELVVTIINIGLMAVIAAAALRLRRPQIDRERVGSGADRRKPGRAAAVWLCAAAALWVEPVTTTLGYGQIDLLITALVVLDLSCGRHSRAGGLGIGLAAALKLTPLIFIPYLLLTGRGRIGLRALSVFALSVAVSLIALPGDASSFWFGGKFMDFSRVTGGNHLAGTGAANQSLRGAVLRMLPGAPDPLLIWLLVALAVGAAGLLLAVRAARRGDEAWGFLLTALTGLLVSPVSWTHHWTIAVAGALAILGTGRRTVVRAITTAAAVLFGLYTSVIWMVIRRPPVWQHASAGRLLLGNLYVLAAVAALAAAAAVELRRALRRRTATERDPRDAAVVPLARRPSLSGTAPLLSAGTGHAGDPLLVDQS